MSGLNAISSVLTGVLKASTGTPDPANQAAGTVNRDGVEYLIDGKGNLIINPETGEPIPASTDGEIGKGEVDDGKAGVSENKVSRAARDSLASQNALSQANQGMMLPPGAGAQPQPGAKKSGGGGSSGGAKVVLRREAQELVPLVRGLALVAVLELTLLIAPGSKLCL